MKATEIKTHDIDQVKFIKYVEGKMFLEETSIKDR